MKKLLPVLVLLPMLAPGAELDFYRDVFPFLKANCISCHNKTTTKAELNMETPELMKKGGDSGPSIVPGKSGESLLVQASLHQNDMEMPPENNKSGAVQLTPPQVALLKRWIDEGAKSSVAEKRTVVWKPLAAGVHPIYAVAMTQDGRYAACGRSNRIFVYDLATRQLVTEIGDAAEKGKTAHRALVQSLAFSPDGSRLASGSFREVKVWKLADPKASAESKPVTPRPVDAALLKKISDAGKVSVTAQTMSADGKQVLTGCSDGSVRLWDAASAKQVAEFRATLEQSRKQADLEWAVAREQLEQAFQTSEVTRIAAQDTALDVLLKKAEEAIVAMKKVLPAKQKEVKPAQAAVAAAQKAVDAVKAEIAKAPGGKPDAALEKKLKGEQDKLITEKTKEREALAGVAAAEGNVKDAEEEKVRINASKAENAKAVAAAKAATADSKKKEEKAAADLAALKTAIAKSASKAVAVAFSSDGQRVVAAFDDDSLQAWAVVSGQPVESVKGGGMKTQIREATDGSMTVTRSVTLAAAGAPQWVLERRLGGDQQPDLFADRVNAVCFSPDGKTLATGGGELSRSGDVILFDAASGKAVKVWKDRHDDAVLSLDFSPDGKLLASGASDKIAKITEVATGKHVYGLEGHTHHVTGVAFRADGRVLATAGADGVVMSWDMILGERKKKIEGWTKEVTSVQFLGATNQILTSAGDNLVRIVNDDGAQIRAINNLPDFMQSAAGTDNAATLIGGGEDSVLRVWDGTSGKELAAFEAN
ncbi:MAG: hypothetical protein KDK99_02455 [Verrucomicrobiales bacterium]|nr:hypothetical protein [Verrucomicrobiales bacterium]